MITLFLFLVFLGGLTFQHWMRPQLKGTSTLRQFRVPIIVTALLFVPIVLFNTSPSDGQKMSREEHIAFLEKYGGENEVIEAYERFMKSNERDLELRFRFVKHVSTTVFFDKESLRNYTFSTNKFVQQQSIAYAEAYLFPYDSIAAKPIKGAPYSNFILAVEQTRKGNPLLAKLYYYQELDVQPQNKTVLHALLELSRRYFPEDYTKFLTQKRFIQTLSLPEQRYIHFQRGAWWSYFKVINEMTFGDIQLLAFVAALAIAIMWMLFLRSLDVFNKEKWRDILIVFILGALYTHLCLIGYDFAHYSLNFTINGTALNDFFYCSFVIGLSEELVKLLPWFLFLWLSKKAKEPYDYLLYASVAALGFAFVENFSYLENPGNITTRSIMSTVAHMFFSSIVAYGVILGRYKAKTTYLKIGFPIAGFLLACLAHGFYDFWLISPAVEAFSTFTIVFFVLSVHVWFLFLNNAINNSPFYVARAFNPTIQLDMLAIGIVSILALEYVIMNEVYGTEHANNAMRYRGWMVPVFLSYVIVLFSEFKVVKGKWKRFRINIPRAFQFFANRGKFSEEQTISSENYDGLELRLFVQKSNRYVADKFPVSGVCSGNITVSGADNWVLFRVTTEFSYAGFKSDYMILRPKESGASLTTDKVEILLLFVPVGTPLDGQHLETTQLRFTGRAFARTV